MLGKTRPVPHGFHRVTPSLVVNDASHAISFYQQAFGAEAKNVYKSPEGKVIHAELEIGDSMIMVSDEFPGSPCRAPQPGAATSVSLCIYIENADETFNRAISAGATQIMPMADAFWGDRYGQLKDPFGHVWSVAARKEDISDKDMEKRIKEFFSKPSAQPGAQT